MSGLIRYNLVKILWVFVHHKDHKDKSYNNIKAFVFFVVSY